MAVIGGITVLIGAALAFVQDDIKKVLAYSTISQLGYMVMALGVGAWTAAVFHLFTHAFFKADLFLGAGSVSHSGSHHSFDMKKDMGGLKKYMPQTYWTFVIGTLALAGIFPLAGFWSKDEILVNAGHNGYKVFLVVGLVGAFMTAAYMTRCVYLTFFGEYRGRRTSSPKCTKPKCSPRATSSSSTTSPTSRTTTCPASATTPTPTRTVRTRATGSSPAALGAVVLRGVRGLHNVPHFDKFENWFQPRVRGSSRCEPGEVQRDPRDRLGRDRARSASGVACAYYWLGAGPQRLAERNALARAGKHFLVMKYYLDVLYDRHHRRRDQGPDRRRRLLVQPERHRQRAELRRPRRAGLGRLTYEYVDQQGVDGFVNGIATVTGEAGGEVRQRPDRSAAVLRT